ncbi:hypothetical protein A1Q2_04592 [Trichosporon asahii var. asahii CBS 8904]|uniref:Uncharacterized protein n=1 Tax=Trichosporon asahii var. asahii (strain CBS 8904) TaxID=1220162 RepID=K1WI43_TRIAC|nr:hypothetical protein A1Q2_04592 [Trichosporon asahii var. asahii CBS 8904]
MSSDRDLEQSEAQIAAAKAELAAAKAELAATQADLAATQADLAVVQVELASVKTTSAQFAKLQDEENAQPMRRIKDLEDDIVTETARELMAGGRLLPMMKDAGWALRGEDVMHIIGMSEGRNKCAHPEAHPDTLRPLFRSLCQQEEAALVPTHRASSLLTLDSILAQVTPEVVQEEKRKHELGKRPRQLEDPRALRHPRIRGVSPALSLRFREASSPNAPHHSAASASHPPPETPFALPNGPCLATPKAISASLS